MPRPIDLAAFETIVRPKLGTHFDRAAAAFEKFGPALAFDVTNVLIHAADQDKVETVLEILERHYHEHLQFQHPDIRGQVSGWNGNPTAQMFLNICTETLGLRPNR